MTYAGMPRQPQAQRFDRTRTPLDRLRFCNGSLEGHRNLGQSGRALVRNKGLTARLTLVGPWPDLQYERRIRQQIADCGLQREVTITGHVGKNELHRHYATSAGLLPDESL